jgi:D-sedoheptulose 7-phosphate isomerase
MDLIEAISDRFALLQSLYRETVDSLAPALAVAAERLAEAVLAGQRVWVVSDPAQRHLAAHFVDRLWFPSEKSRPPFAALFLPADQQATDNHPLSVLVQQGDPIIALFGTTPSTMAEAALQVGIDADCPVIAIGHDGNDTLWPRLRGTDIAIALPDLPLALHDELLLFTLHTLTETWEAILLGEIL